MIGKNNVNIQSGRMKPIKLIGIRACVFDAYGTLFDVSSVARGAQAEIGEQWQSLSDLWRSKQLQYTWLRGLSGQYADFWQVTGDALDYAMSSLRLEDRELREKLMRLYLSLSAYPEVPEVLQDLKDGGMPLAILSNGTPNMLKSVASNSGIIDLFDEILSADEIKTYKPHPSVYQLASNRLHVESENICFISSNAWDAYSAKAFGFQVLWCNRFKQAPENIPASPNAEINDLACLPNVILT